MKLVLTIIMACGVCVNGWSQNGWTGQVSPVPLWPLNGDISRFPTSQYIYAEPATSSYVVAIRSTDGRVERVLRAPIHNGVAPAITVAVSADSFGLFHYHYTVSNGKSAPMPIERWALAVEEVGHRLNLSHAIASSPWKGGRREAKLPGISRDQHEVYQWESPGDGPLSAGQSMSGFEIVSDLAPGFVLAVFYGKAAGPELSAADWQALPEPAAAQLRQALGTVWDSKTEYVIGPQFGSNASAEGVEASFLFGVRLLKTQNRTMADSATKAGLEAELDNALRDPTRPLLPSTLDSIVKQSAPGETETINALRLALGALRTK